MLKAIRELAPNIDRREPSLFLAALLYLFVPSALVLFYFSEWPALVVPAVGLAFFLLYPEAKTHKAQFFILLSHTWPFLVLSAGIVWLSGILPPFAENTDWHKHYAIFNAMASQSWPPKFITNDGASTLRYSLGYYVIPALTVKWFGGWILSAAIFVWSTLGCYFALVLAFGTKSRTAMQAFLIGLVFLLFSGADILGTYLTGAFPSPSTPLMHFEWWASFGALPSAVTSIFWTPQHLIAGWVGSFLFFRYPLQAVRHSGLIVCAAAIWSPFIAIGLVPTFVWAVHVTGFGKLLTKSNVMVAPVLLLIAALFLGKGSEGIPFSLIWNGNGFSVINWILFIFLEFILIVVALLFLNPGARVIILIHGAFLLILCFFNGGALNDLLMRASIPSLGVLAIFFASSLVCMPNEARKIPILLLFLAGLTTPFSETWRGFVSPRVKNPDEISILSIVDKNRELKAQYFAPSNEKIALLPSIVNERDLELTQFGDATFDAALNRVSSDSFADAGMASQVMVLPIGYYKLDATLDWNIGATSPGVHGGHISIHGVKILIPVPESQESNKLVSSYFYSDGKPLRISFGLGGWGIGRGFIQLKKLQISPVEGWGR